LRTAPILLLTRGDVRAELKLTPEQVALSEAAIADFHDRALALKGRNDTDAVAARGEVETASRAWLEKNLTQAQRDRLIQLDYQWEGPSAVITRAYVAESLGLTDAQRQALSQAVIERNRRREAGPRVEADEARFAETVRGQLTEDQHLRLRAILGTPFTFRSTTPATSTR
jgi:hypothetical protein